MTKAEEPWCFVQVGVWCVPGLVGVCLWDSLVIVECHEAGCVGWKGDGILG